MAPKLTIVRDAFPTEPGLDTAIGRALLVRASAGDVGETFRIHVPGRVLAFGKHDALSPGYSQAMLAAEAEGFLPILRLAGGRAAVFHEHTLAFHWTTPDRDPRSGITRRFERIAALMVGAYARLGIDTRIGEVPGEYCPGRYSVNLDGSHKVMGVGQRLAKHAAHVGGVIVVDDVPLTNRPLLPVYAALGIEWRAHATGALAMARPDLTTAKVIEAVLAELGADWDLEAGSLDAPTLALARELAADHLPSRAAHAG